MPFQSPGAVKVNTTGLNLAESFGRFRFETSVAALPGGGQVIVWSSNDGADGDGECIRARFYDAAGQPVGDDFIVNTTAAGDQYSAAVEILPDGRLFFAWVSKDYGDGTNGNIRGRMFNANHSPAGADYVISGPAASASEDDPVIGRFGDGRMLVSWGVESVNGVYGRILNGNGAIVGSEFAVTNAGRVDGPFAFATLANGDIAGVHVAVTFPGGQTRAALVLRVFDADSPTSYTDREITSTGIQGFPPAYESAQYDIAVLPTGTYMVAWSATFGDGDGRAIKAQIFNRNHQPVGAEIQVNANGADQQIDPVVSALDDGRFLVAWQRDESGSAIALQIGGRMFLADGTPASDEFTIAAPAQFAHAYLGDVAVLDNGYVAVSWWGWGESPNYREIQRTMFKPTEFSGTDVADTLIGGSLTDSMSGNGGSDVLGGGGGNDFLSGGGGNNNLNGGSGNDWLSSEAGAIDTLIGGTGNDMFLVTDAGDSVAEAANGGTDVIVASVSCTLPTYVENAQVGGTTANITVTGNALANTFTGGSGGNTFSGGGGDDRFLSAGGADLMYGGTGNDVFYVNSNADRVRENVGEGIDTVVASADFGLFASAEIENLRTADPTGTSPIELRGNAFTQAIAGNDGNNILRSFGGNDRLAGRGGNDFYDVRGGDSVFEAANGGFDTVSTGTSFALSAGTGVERLQAADGDATTAINLAGNEHAQQIFGNEGNNQLSGRGGADILQGFGGNDVYVNPKGATIVEAPNGGIDTVKSDAAFSLGALPNLERLILTGTAAIDGFGNALANILTGNAGRNTLIGLDGADTLDGGGGNDLLAGGTGNDRLAGSAGNDIFRFGAASGTDTIVDFNRTDDRFDLGGKAFTSAAVAGANTLLTYDGGKIWVQGLTDLTLGQWNNLRIPTGGRQDNPPSHPQAVFVHDDGWHGGGVQNADYIAA